MKRLLFILPLLLTGALAYLIWQGLNQGLTRSDEEVLAGVQSYGGTIAVPDEEAKPYFERTTKHLSSYNWWGNSWKMIAKFFSWGAFLLATIVTGVAAYFGNQGSPQGMTPDQTVNILRERAGKNAWIIGSIAAGIAIFTAISDRAGAESVQSYKRADEIGESMRQTRKAIVDGKVTKEEAIAMLEDMETRAER